MIGGFHGCRETANSRVAKSVSNRRIENTSSYITHPKLQISDFWLYTDLPSIEDAARTERSSGDRYPGVPRPSSVVLPIDEEPGMVNPKSAIFQAPPLYENSTKY